MPNQILDGRVGRWYRVTMRFFGRAPFDDPALKRSFAGYFRAAGFDQLVFALGVMTFGSAVVYVIFALSGFEPFNWFGGNQGERAKRALVIGGTLVASIVFRRQLRKHWEWFSIVVVAVVYVMGVLSLSLRMFFAGTPVTDIGGWRTLTTQILLIFMTFPFIRVRLWILVVAAASSSTVIVANGFNSTTHMALGATAAFFAIFGGCAIWVNNYRRERDLFDRTIELEVAVSAARSAEIRANDLAYQQRQLVNAITHDIRQPMSSIGIQMALLRRASRNGNSSPAMDLGALSFALNALQSQLDEISNRVTKGGGASEPDVTPIDIVPCVAMAVQFHEPLAKRHGLSIRMHRNHRFSTMIGMTNLGYLSTVLESIIANAIKFRKHHGEPNLRGVVIGIRRHARRIIIRIVDNGVGIKADDLPHIFNAGFSAGTASGESGNGFGLFNVRRLISSLPNHSITVASRREKYTVFTITLPESGESDLSREVQPNQYSDSVDGTVFDGEAVDQAFLYRKILIVENDERVAASMSELLRSLGAGVTVASTSDAGKARIVDSEIAFDALICDYRLDENHTGDEVIRFAQDYYGTKRAALIVSGDYAASQADFGDIPLLRKPFNPEELVEVLIRELSTADLISLSNQPVRDRVPT